MLYKYLLNRTELKLALARVHERNHIWVKPIRLIQNWERVYEADRVHSWTQTSMALLRNHEPHEGFQIYDAKCLWHRQWGRGWRSASGLWSSGLCGFLYPGRSRQLLLPKEELWGLSSCKLKAALESEELPGGAPHEFHVSFMASNGGRPERWQEEVTIWVYLCWIQKVNTWRVNILGPQCHTGLPGVSQPDHAQDGVGAAFDQSGSTQSWPPSNVISSLCQIPSLLKLTVRPTWDKLRFWHSALGNFLLQTHLQLLHHGLEVTRVPSRCPEGSIDWI